MVKHLYVSAFRSNPYNNMKIDLKTENIFLNQILPKRESDIASILPQENTEHIKFAAKTKSLSPLTPSAALSPSQGTSPQAITCNISAVNGVCCLTGMKQSSCNLSNDIEIALKSHDYTNLDDKSLPRDTTSFEEEIENSPLPMWEMPPNSKRIQEKATILLSSTTQGKDIELPSSQIHAVPSSTAVRDICLPDPLPSYISRQDRPTEKVLKRSLRCATCDVYVNSENQMKQHINSLRHKNTLQGIPIPPKPEREDKCKLRAEQYHCSICKVTLNSDIQLSQHLSSQRHRSMLEGKPPKPRWSPYGKMGHGRVQTAAKILPYNLLSNQPFLPSAFPASAAAKSSISSLIPGMNVFPAVPSHISPAPNPLLCATPFKPAPFVLRNGSLSQASKIVYVGIPQLPSLPIGATHTSALPPVQGLAANQQPFNLLL